MKRKYLLLFLPLLFFLFFFPGESLKASCEGVSLWFHTVLPTLLPFIILSNLLVRSGAVMPLLARLNPVWNRLFGLTSGGAYCLALGLLCGFPMGARLSADLLKNERITKEEASYLLCFCNNASPMFLSGYIATGCLGNSSSTLPVFLIYYLSLLLCMILFRLRYHRFGIRTRRHGKKEEASHLRSLGELMDASIMDGFDVIARLGGYIILFTIYSSMLAKLCSSVPEIHPAAAMLLEITTGAKTLLTSGWDARLKFAFLMAGIAFGGLSTLAQTSSMICGSGLRPGLYARAKLLQGMLTFAVACLWLFFFV